MAPFCQLRGEAGNRLRLGIESLKQSAELRDDQQMLQTRAEVEQLEMPIHPSQGCIAGDEFTQPAAVHVLDARHVDDQLAGSGINGVIDMPSELRISIQREVALKIQNSDVVQRALDDVHLYSSLYLFATTCPRCHGH